MRKHQLQTPFPIFLLMATALFLGVATTTMATSVVYAQEEEDDDDSNSGGDDDGGVTATVSQEAYYKGDAVTISGSVGEEGSGDNSLYARVYDPDAIELDIERIHVNADGTFRYGFNTDAGVFEGGL